MQTEDVAPLLTRKQKHGSYLRPCERWSPSRSPNRRRKRKKRRSCQRIFWRKRRNGNPQSHQRSWSLYTPTRVTFSTLRCVYLTDHSLKQPRCKTWYSLCLNFTQSTQQKWLQWQTWDIIIIIMLTIMKIIIIITSSIKVPISDHKTFTLKTTTTNLYA